MNKTIQTKDLEVTLAGVALSIKNEPSTIQLVLAEIIRASEGGTITHPSHLQPSICKHLKITPTNYRRAIAQLTKLRLIARDQSIIVLDPIIRTPFNAVILKQK